MVNGTNVAQNDIVRRDPVGGDEQEVIRRRCRVDISYFALRDESQVGEMGVDECSHDCR